MITKIKFKKGLAADFKSVELEGGEPAFLLDTGKLYVGNGTEKILINEDYGTAADKNTGTNEGDVPVLGPDGKLPPEIIPAMAVTEVFVVDSKTAMLKLPANVGDMAIRTDENKTYVLGKEPATTFANWIYLPQAECGVISVAGKQGEVELVVEDIGGLQTELNKLMPKSGGTFTGAVFGQNPSSSCNDNTIPTTKWVNDKIGEIVFPEGAVTSVAGKTGKVELDIHDIEGLDGALDDKADINSPEFTGTPTTPNIVDGDPDDKIANKKYVDDKIATIEIDYPVTKVNDKVGEVVLTGADIELTGYTKPATESPIVATDTVNEAIGKIDKALECVDGGNF